MPDIISDNHISNYRFMDNVLLSL